jgi:hypothetical protein
MAIRGVADHVPLVTLWARGENTPHLQAVSITENAILVGVSRC